MAFDSDPWIDEDEMTYVIDGNQAFDDLLALA